MLELLLYLFIVAFSLQIIYIIVVFGRLLFYQEKNNSASGPLPPVSVVICAKNEAANLRKNLPFILSQNYPHFEVVVVNDASEDETASVLKEFQRDYPNLKVVELQPSSSKAKGKKAALKHGLEVAQHSRVLLTDADCQPAGNDWIREMMEGKENKIVLGYSPVYRERGWLNRFVRFETVLTALQYLNLALWKQPLMGVGRNLSYATTVIPPAVAFTEHADLLSGDDDLVVNRYATGTNTAISIAPASWVWTWAKSSFRSWFRQKSRHLSTGIRYQMKHQVILGIFNGSHFLFYLLLIILLLFSGNFALLSSFYLLRLAVLFIIVSGSFIKLGQKDLIWAFPLLDFGYWGYLIVFSPAVFFNKNKIWK